MRVGGLHLLVRGAALAGLCAVADKVLDSFAGLGSRGDVNREKDKSCARGVSGRWFSSTKCSVAMLQSHSKMASSLAIDVTSDGSGSQNIKRQTTNESKAGTNAATMGNKMWHHSKRSLGALVRNAKAFSRHCYRHTGSLQRAMDGVKESHIPTNQELDSLMAKFENSQASALDTCPVQLMQARKQLELLHVMVSDLSAEINTSEIQIQTTTVELTNVHVEQQENDEVLHEETIACEKKTAEDKKFFEMVKKELLELQNIGNWQNGHFNPTTAVDEFVKQMEDHGNFNINYSSGGVSSWTGSASYQEFPAPALYWRVANAHPTTQRPYVKSFQMFTDFDCKIPVLGDQLKPQPICSGMMGGASACYYTMFGQNATRWFFDCNQCDKDQAWVGVKLESPAPVKCVHVTGTLSGQEDKGLILETSKDGTSWTVVSDVSNADTVVVIQGQTSPQQLTAALASTHQMGGFVALQEGAAPLRASTKPRAKVLRRPTEQSVNEPRLLAKKTKALANELMACLAKNKGGHAKKVEKTRGASLLEVLPVAPTVGPGIDECEEQKHILQITFSRAYVDLSRVVAQYAKLVVDTGCIDAATETHKQRDKPLASKVEVLSTRLTTQTGSLQSFRSRIESANHAEVKLRLLILSLTQKCAAMEDTSDSLDKIRDAIHVLDLCPGLYNTVNFSVPVFVGWALGEFSSFFSLDAEIDSAMNALCASLRDDSMTTNPRAAETAEIEERTVENAPETNTAARPLIAACPQCEGLFDIDMQGLITKSGHARVCWDVGVLTNAENKRTDCLSGKKAVMCVLG